MLIGTCTQQDNLATNTSPVIFFFSRFQESVPIREALRLWKSLYKNSPCAGNNELQVGTVFAGLC